MPLNKHRSSMRGLPLDLGKKDSRRAICAFVSQKRSDMVGLQMHTNIAKQTVF